VTARRGPVTFELESLVTGKVIHYHVSHFRKLRKDSGPPIVMMTGEADGGDDKTGEEMDVPAAGLVENENNPPLAPTPSGKSLQSKIPRARGRPQGSKNRWGQVSNASGEAHSVPAGQANPAGSGNMSSAGNSLVANSPVDSAAAGHPSAATDPQTPVVKTSRGRVVRPPSYLASYAQPKSTPRATKSKKSSDKSTHNTAKSKQK